MRAAHQKNDRDLGVIFQKLESLIETKINHLDSKSVAFLIAGFRDKTLHGSELLSSLVFRCYSDSNSFENVTTQTLKHIAHLAGSNHASAFTHVPLMNAL